MLRLTAFAALLLGSTAAHAERVQLGDCQQIGGPPLALSELPWAVLNRPGKVTLVCPFTQSFAGYRVHYNDPNTTEPLGSSSVRVWVAGLDFLNAAVPAIGCTFGSNQPGVLPHTAYVACGFTASETSYQAFVVELWTRQRPANVRFLAVETWQ